MKVYDVDLRQQPWLKLSNKHHIKDTHCAGPISIHHFYTVVNINQRRLNYLVDAWKFINEFCITFPVKYDLDYTVFNLDRPFESFQAKIGLKWA